MPRRRPVEAFLAIGATVVAFALAVVWVLTSVHSPPKLAATAESWRGLVGQAPTAVEQAQRMIVLLKAPSMAARVETAGGFATEAQERAWTAAAYASQRRLLASLKLDGITIQPDFSYARVVNGFSAELDPRALVLLQHSPLVSAVYPVRAA